MEKFNYTTSDDYAITIIYELMKARVNPELVTHMIPLTKEKAASAYNDYIAGQRDSAFLSVEEIEEVRYAAIEVMAREAISNLIDKDLARTVIGEDGEVAYQLTDAGKRLADQMKNELE